MFFLYLLTAVLWGIFATGMKMKLDPRSLNGGLEIMSTFILNALLCPFSIVRTMFDRDFFERIK